MNKKIKALVQKYEKDMQFENRFEDLKEKLDLIPDQNNHNEVYVIRKKLMPAYVMTIVLLMLVTGIIGLQLGLNSNYITGPERVDLVESQLGTYMDIYQREAVETISINSEFTVFVYIGYHQQVKTILIRVLSKTPSILLTGTIDSSPIIQTSNPNFYVVSIQDANTVFDISVIRNNATIADINSTIDLTAHFNWLQG